MWLCAGWFASHQTRGNGPLPRLWRTLTSWCNFTFLVLQSLSIYAAKTNKEQHVARGKLAAVAHTRRALSLHNISDYNTQTSVHPCSLRIRLSEVVAPLPSSQDALSFCKLLSRGCQAPSLCASPSPVSPVSVCFHRVDINWRNNKIKCRRLSIVSLASCVYHASSLIAEHWHAYRRRKVITAEKARTSRFMFSQGTQK